MGLSGISLAGMGIDMFRQSICVFAVVTLSLGAVGCRPGPHRVADEQQPVEDRSSPAYKAGAAAHEIVNGAEKAAKAAGRKLDESARKAREGWKEKGRESRDREADRP